jgi:outer membrane protein assembly factor BamB
MKTLVTTMLLGSTVWLQAADWPNWRGPEHNGISQETDWFEKWGSSGPKRLWSASVGTGSTTVSVADGRVFTMGNKSNRDTVYALEEATGDILWRHSYSEALSPIQYDGGPSSTPTVDGEYVYTLSKTGKAFCLVASTGDEVWNRDLKQLYSLPTPTWGFASSPVIHGDKVVYNVSSRGIALSKTNGSLKWKTASGTPGYATPVRYDHRGTEAFIMFGPSYAYGVNAATGKQLWSKSFTSMGSDINAADPVLYNGKIFLSTSNFNPGCELIELSGTSTSSKWKNGNMRIYFNAGVVIGDYLYGGSTPHSAVRCINMETGETQWTKKSIPCASITAADAKLIILSRTGDLYIAEPSPSHFMQLAKAKVITGTCLTVPVLANRSLYVRNSRGTLNKLQMSEMVIEPQPLAVNFAGSDLEFSWPAKGNFALESTDALGQAADWSEIGGRPPTTEDDRYVVRVRPSAAQQFFRLRSE